MRPQLLTTVVVLVVTACQATRERGTLVSTRDSAGVEIVEIPAAALAALPAWTLDSTPLVIGQAFGDDSYQLNLARSPWRLSDGRIVVANALKEIRYYDSTGTHLATVGRDGNGPGEYGQLSALLRRAGDTLLAFDTRPPRRITVLDPHGRLVRTYTFAASFANPPGISWLSDGSAVFLGYGKSPALASNGTMRNGVAQDTNTLIHLSFDGARHDTLTRLPGQWLNVRSGWYKSVTFSGQPFLASHDTVAVVGLGDTFALAWYDLVTGKRVRSTRVNVALRPVTDRDIAVIHAAEAVAEARRRARLPLRTEKAPDLEQFAKFLPVIEIARMDRDSHAWIRRWTSGEDKIAEWIVFDRAGRPIARTRLPSALLPNDIGADYVLGIFVDDDGVQSVRQYRLSRGPRSPSR